MISRHTQRTWDQPAIENKYHDLKRFWRVFQVVDGWSGTSYDPTTGKIDMSDDNKENLRQRYPRWAKKIINEGITVEGDITFDTWANIFSSDRPAGDTIIEAGDDEAFDNVRLQRSQPSDEDLDNQEDQSVNEGETQASTLLDGSDNEENPFTATPMRLETPGESPTARIPPNEGIRRRSRKRRDRLGNEGQAVNEGIKALTDALIARDSQPRQHHIVTRMVGAEDMETAIKDCFEFTKERGMQFSIRLVRWLREDPMNPLLWNSLPSREAKDAWLDDQVNDES